MIILKVFSGEQSGAEFDLPPNIVFEISNKYDADIYLVSNSIDRKSCAFTVTDTDTDNPSIQFSSLDDAIKSFDNTEIATNTALSLPCYIDFDGINIAIGGSASISNWPIIEHIDTHLNDELINSDNETSIEPTQSDQIIKNGIKERIYSNKYFILFMGYFVKYKQIIKDKSLEVFEFIKKKLIYFHKIYPKYLYGVFAISTVLIIIIYSGTAFYINTKTINANKQQHDALMSLVKSKFANLPNKYMNLDLQNTETGYLVCGLIDGKDDKKFIVDTFKDYAKILKFDLTSAEDAKNKIQAALKDANVVNLHTVYDKETQNIVINGIALDGLGKINDAQIVLNSYLPCINNVDFSKIYDLKQIKDDVTSVINSIGMTLDVKEDLPNGKITLSGFLTDRQSNLLHTNLLKLDEKYSGVISFNLDIKDAIIALPFKIYTVYTGNPAYIVTDENKHLYLGGELLGMKLMAITTSKIIFSGKYNIEIPMDAISGDDPDSNASVTNEAEADSKDNIGIGGGSGNGSSNNNSSGDVGQVVGTIPMDNIPANSSRAIILNNEFDKLKDSIGDGQKKLEQLKNYQAKVNDKDINTFLQQQVNNLEQDLSVKNQELQYYSKKGKGNE